MIPRSLLLPLLLVLVSTFVTRQSRCATLRLLNPNNGSKFAYRGRKRPPLNIKLAVEGYEVGREV